MVDVQRLGEVAVLAAVAWIVLPALRLLVGLAAVAAGATAVALWLAPELGAQVADVWRGLDPRTWGFLLPG